MRVLHVTSGNRCGSIETGLATIARHRDAAPELDSQFAVCFDRRLRTGLEATGANVHVLGPVRNLLGVRRTSRALRAAIDRENIDVVVCHSSWPLAIFGPVAIERARKRVLWQHGAAVEGAAWLEQWARKARPDLVICNSGFTATSLRSVSDAENITGFTDSPSPADYVSPLALFCPYHGSD